MQGEFLREGLWGEQVQGEGRRNRRAKPGPRGSAAGSAPLRGARLRRRFLRLAEVCEGAGARPWGPGACVLQGLAKGQGWGRQPRRPQGAGPGEARQPRRGGCRPVPHPPQACP